jgi:hypothetical protein
MGQVLVIEKGRLDIDKTYVQAGETPTYAMQAGQRMLIKDGTPAMPTIHLRGKSFFYDDGSPVTNAEHVEHLPERQLIDGKIVNIRDLARVFVQAHQPSAVPGKPGGVTVRHADNPRRVRKQKRVQAKDVELYKGAQKNPERLTDPD